MNCGVRTQAARDGQVSGFAPVANTTEYTVTVIVMTFWYVFWNGLTFFELFKLLFFTWD